MTVKILRSTTFYIILVLLSLSHVTYGYTGRDPSDTPTLRPSSASEEPPTDDGKPELSDGSPVTVPIVKSVESNRPTLRSTLSAQASPNAPVLTVWYGARQKFGHNGNPQRWVNILGNATSATDIVSLAYSLNGGAPTATTLGPDTRRLADPGDFNLELAYTDLVAGENLVVITATNSLALATVQNVVVDYIPNQAWPQTYHADWATATTIADLGQIVDGQWQLTGTGVRPRTFDYDRLIAIGDASWTNYEVTVPVTIYGIDDPDGFKYPSSGPGIGILMNWSGHFQQTTEHPTTGWQKFGALGWYRWGKDAQNNIIGGQQMLAYYGITIGVNPGKQPQLNTPTMMKMSVQSSNGSPTIYRFKTWAIGAREPLAWDIIGQGHPRAPTKGSMLLVAHHVDAEFGVVDVQPLASIPIALNYQTIGDGNITVDPMLATYEYGQSVTISATPSIGFSVQWSGDLTGTEQVQQFEIYKNTVVTATFVSLPAEPLIVDVIGNGQVAVEPQKVAYRPGETVTVTAIADAGHIFSGWQGALAGFVNPIQYTIAASDTITATFVDTATLTPPLSDDFNACKLNARWRVSDPRGDVNITLNGKQLHFTIPQDVDHDLWQAKNFAPRVMEPASNTDFTVEAKFESVPAQPSQIQGILIEQDSDNFLRFDFFHDGQGLKLFAAIFATSLSAPDTRVNQYITPPPGTNLYLQIQRSGDSWVVHYSFDGSNWTTMPSFSHPLTVSAAGIFAGNTSSQNEPIPAYTAIVDYFFNIAAAGTPEDAVGQILPTVVKPTGKGEVLKSTECGNPVTLDATPIAGWSFDHWASVNGSVTGSTTPTQTNFVDGDIVTAFFTQDEYVLTAIVDDGVPGDVGGSIVKSAPMTLTNYIYNEQVNIIATANPGWTFDAWSGAGLLGNTPAQTVTMTQSAVISATFAPIPYTLVLNTVGSGQVTVMPQQATYVYGDVVTLTATPAAGWSLDAWSGVGLAGTGLVQTITVTQDAVISATFSAIPYRVDLNRVGSGQVTVVPEQMTYVYGDEVTLTATPDAGWSFDAWGGSGTSGNTTPLALTIQDHTSLIATFTPDEYMLTTASTAGGSVTVEASDNPVDKLRYNDAVTLRAVPDDGYSFLSWRDSRGNASSENPVTWVVTSTHVITAAFTEDNVNLIALMPTTTGDGSVMRQPHQALYTVGQKVIVTATPKAGWQFVKWVTNARLEAGQSVAGQTITIEIQAGVTLAAVFEQESGRNIYLPAISAP